jgi:predicted dehydrogenase
MRRRTFLAATAAASAAPLLAAEADAPVALGFVGVGNRGHSLLTNALKLPGVTVAAVCDTDPKMLERAVKTVADSGRPKPFATADWKELLDRKDVAAVVSALPIDLHARNYAETIAAGKDLYGEKPLALTLAECDRVAAAAGRSDRVVQIGFQRRANPFFVESMKAVHAGELGELVEGRIAWSNAWGPLGGWFGKKERSGDWMLEQACHNWDVLNWALKSVPVRAMGMGRAGLFTQFQPDRTVTDYYAAVVEYPNGVIVNIVHSWVVPGQQGKYNPAFNFEYTQLVGTTAGIDFNSGTLSYRKELNKPDRKVAGKFEYNEATQQALAAFLNSVRTRTPPVASVQHGRDAAAASLLVRAAVDGRRVVTLDEVAGKG